VADKRQLTPAEVLAIRAKWDTGRFTARGIAQVYGCAAETVARIGRRETWAWLSEEAATQPREDAAASLERVLAELKDLPTDQGGEDGTLTE
jgi:hypothetical protein